MTYQEERKIKDRAHAAKARKYHFCPVLMDKGARHLSGLKYGELVIKTPAPGLGQCSTRTRQVFIGDGITGEFIGMVCRGSLCTRTELKRAYYELPVTATPSEFLAGLGNWGLTEEEAKRARLIASVLTGKAVS